MDTIRRISPIIPYKLEMFQIEIDQYSELFSYLHSIPENYQKNKDITERSSQIEVT